VLCVGWDMLVGFNPEPFPSPNKVEGEAIMTDRCLGSLRLACLLGSTFCLAGSCAWCSLGPASVFPSPLSCESTPVSLRISHHSGTLTPWGFTGTSWASGSKGYMVSCSRPSVQVTLILSSWDSSFTYSPSPLGAQTAFLCFMVLD
jgi:hypothetical protein